jgi:hypothetical protein
MFSVRLFKQSSKWEDVLMLSRQNKYRVSIKSFPDYKYLLQENYVEYKHIFFSKCNSTQEVFLQHISTLKKMFVFHVVFL